MTIWIGTRNARQKRAHKIEASSSFTNGGFYQGIPRAERGGGACSPCSQIALYYPAQPMSRRSFGMTSLLLIF